MQSFQEMFEKSKGRPISYNGKTLVMSDDFPINGTNKFRLVFEKCNGKWRQGVALHFEGKIKVNGQLIKQGLYFGKIRPHKV